MSNSASSCPDGTNGRRKLESKAHGRPSNSFGPARPVNFPWKRFSQHRNRAVFIRDLPYHWRKEELHRMMNSHGCEDMVEEVIVWCSQQSKSMQVACVLLTNEAHVPSMLSTFHNIRCDGRDIKVSKYNPNTPLESVRFDNEVRVSFLAGSYDIPRISEATIRTIFESNFGDLSNVCIRAHKYSPEGIQSGYGFIAFVDDVHASQVVANVRHVTFNNIQFDCAWSTPKRQQVTKPSSLNSLEVSDRGDTTTDGSHLMEERSSSTISVLRFSPDSRSVEMCPSSETNGSCGDSIVSELADSFATQSLDFRAEDSPSKAPHSAMTQSSKPAARRRISNRAVRALSDDCDSVAHTSSSIETTHASPSPMSPLSPLSMAPPLTIPLGQQHMSAVTTMHPISYIQVSRDHTYAATPMINAQTLPTAMLHSGPIGLPVQVQLVPYPSPSGPWYFVPHNPR